MPKPLITAIRTGLIVFMGMNVLYVFVGAYLYPLRHVDVWSIWFLKAKLLYLCPEQWQTALQQPALFFSHPEYPLLWPWLITGWYRLIGGVNEQIVSLLSPVSYVLILYVAYRVFYTLTRRRTLSLAAVYVYSMLPPLIAQAGRLHAGMADLYLCLGYWILLYLRVAKPKIGWWLPTLVVMLMAQLKTEGILAVLLLVSFPYPKKTVLAAGLTALVSPGWWLLTKAQLQLPSSYGVAVPSLVEALIRGKVVLGDMVRELYGNIHNWYLLWYLIPITWAIPATKSSTGHRWLRRLMVGYGIAFFAIYLTSTVSVTGYVASSLDRLLLQVSPVWATLTVIQLTAAVGRRVQLNWWPQG